MDSQLEGATVKSRAAVMISLNHGRLSMLDWRLPVVVQHRDAAGQATVLFSGFIERVEASARGELSVEMSDPTLLLREATIGGAFGSGIPPPEFLYYLLVVCMPDSVSPDGIQVGEGRTLADQAELFTPRMFTFVAPLPVVEAPVDPVSFLDGVIYSGSIEASQDERIILETKFGAPVEEFAEGKARIRFVVRASDFIDAFEQGLQRLRKTLDVISLAANTTGAILPSGSTGQVISYDRARLDRDVSEPGWLFVRDNLPGRPNRHWLRWYSTALRRDPLAISNDHFSAFEVFLRKITVRSNDSLSSRERALLSAVHTLRRSRQAAYTSDSLSLLWQAVEFLVAGFPAKPPVSEGTARRLVKGCVAELRFLEKDASAVDLERMERHVRRGMNLVRSLPLRDKWLALCEEFGIHLNEDEQSLLWSLRSARNDEIHGSKASFKRSDVQRALGIVEKAVLIGIHRAGQPK